MALWSKELLLWIAMYNNVILLWLVKDVSIRKN